MPVQPLLGPLILLVSMTAAPGEQERVFPIHDIGVQTLEARREAQLLSSKGAPVFNGFQFTDRILESGIGFSHYSVDDSAKYWKPAHYDHGNGIAVADVDGDELHDIYLLTQLGSNRLYRNRGDGTFEDITSRSGVGLEDRISVTATFGDIDNDGDPDLYVTTVRGGNVLFENVGEGRFRDVTAAAGVGYVGHSSGSVMLDYDADGRLDLFVTNVGRYTNDERGRGGFFLALEDAFEGHRYPERSERSILFRNLGENRFQDVSETVGLMDKSWSGDATFTDLNGDRLPDLYVLNMQGDDHFYENVGGERFVERTAAHFPKTSWGAMGVKFFDYNNDGLMDLMVTDMHSDMHDEEVLPLLDEKRKYDVPIDDGENNIPGNSFYARQEDGSFLEISDRIGSENFWPWGLSVGDLNADGFQDVFIASSMNFPFRYGVNSVLLNSLGTTFLDSEFVLGVEPRRDGRTSKALFQVDCSVESDHGLCGIWKGEGELGAVTVAGTLGTRASVLFDLDRDGDLDIVTNEFNDVPQLLISNLSENREVHFLEVVLRGTRSNRDGLGAMVAVTAGDSVYTQYHDGKSGYLSQSSLPLYFGLGAHTTVDRIEVTWPSGTRQSVTSGIAINTRLELVEETPPPSG